MSTLRTVKDAVMKYAAVYIKLLKLNVVGKAAAVVSYLIYGMIALFIFFCIFLFAGFGLTEVFSDAGCSKISSFFLTTGCYLLSLLLLFLLRRQITEFFAGRIIAVLTEKTDEHKEQDENEDEEL